MIVIKNKYIPVRGFKAMAVYPFIFVRKGCIITKETITHEKIHFEQQKELLFVGFYLLYLIFWLIYGYKRIPFEQEAYTCEVYPAYLLVRKPFAWLNYIRKAD